MSIIACALHQVFTTDYGDHWYNPPTYSFNKNTLNKKHSYVVVVAPGQVRYMKLFDESKDINILFKSKKAVNKSPYHGNRPRNTVIVFELK